MAYCTNAEVAKDFPATNFSATGAKVSTSDIDEFIQDADALIDSYISSRYAVPVTGDTTALRTLRLFSRSLVADKVKGILEIKQPQNSGANQNVRSGLSTKDVIKLLEQIRDGQSQLTGAQLLSSGGGINSFNVREGKTARFNKDEDQW